MSISISISLWTALDIETVNVRSNKFEPGIRWILFSDVFLNVAFMRSLVCQSDPGR